MKRLAAIAFFVVILFNFYGYRLVISYMESGSNTSLEKKVDQNNYNESDLIVIKTKLNLPYYTGSDQYERVYGSLNIEGINYQYVKRRVHNDTLELLCLPNQATTRLLQVHNELTKSFADGQASTPKKNTTIKVFLPDFFQPVKTFSANCLSQQQSTYAYYTHYTSEGYILKQRKPPKYTRFLSC